MSEHRPAPPSRRRARQPAVARLAEAPFATRTALQLETPGRLYGPTYHRLLRGGHYVSSAPVSHGRRMQAARLVLTPEAVFSGRSAAWALGVRLADPTDAVEVVLPLSRRVRSRQEVRVRADRLLPGEVVASEGFGRVTSPARTAFDLARIAPESVAIGWVDAVLRQTRTAPAAALAVAGRHAGARGVRRARVVLAQADPRAESPRESMLRLLIVVAGLPAPVPQHEVVDPDGRVVARLDLAWPDHLVAVEYDGAHHRAPHQYRRDLRRHNALRARGWVVIQVDAAQLADPATVLEVVRRTLAVGAASGRAR